MDENLYFDSQEFLDKNFPGFVVEPKEPFWLIKYLEKRIFEKGV
jgi:hypothetical protein